MGILIVNVLISSVSACFIHPIMQLLSVLSNGSITIQDQGPGIITLSVSITLSTLLKMRS